jgi:hypothetical protein
MTRRRIRTRRSIGEWGVRGISVLAVASLGYVGVVQSLAYGLRGSNAERGHALAPWDGRISAALAQTLSGPEATSATRAQASSLARAALRQDATAVAAASTLAINVQILGDARGADRLANYAEALSRRDLATQILLIENAVSRNDVAGALRHYDIALRATSKSTGILFPVLAGAIADPEIRPALTRTLAMRPPWSALFLEYASANSPDPRAASLLFRDLGKTGYPISEVSRTLLIDTLASRGLFDDAWSFYVSFRRGADRQSSRDPGLTADLVHPTVFDWRPVTDGGISASLQRGVLDFAAPSSVGGTLVEQVQLLAPGQYRLVGHSIGVDQSPGSSPYWQLRCRDGRELGRTDVPNSASANGNFVGQFTVPTGCSTQILTLIAKPSDAISGISGQIDRVRLSPLR